MRHLGTDWRLLLGMAVALGVAVAVGLRQAGKEKGPRSETKTWALGGARCGPLPGSVALSA